jgi:hypothetical protein
MTELRVFQDLKDRIWVEVTSPKARFTRALFVRAFWELPESLFPASPKEIVIAEFEGKRLSVAYLLISSRRRDHFLKFKQIGVLDDNSSRDVLNNLLDILGYDESYAPKWNT